MNLKMKPTFTRLFLLRQPAFELLGCMSGSIVQDEGHGLDLSVESFRNDRLLRKGLEVDKAFVAARGPVDFAIGHRESSEEMACAAPMIARFVQQRFAWAGRVWRLFPFACLDGGFIIQTDQPDSCTQEGLRLGVSF